MKQSNDLLSDYLNDPAPDTVFIFLEEEIDKRSRLFKQLERDGLAVEYVKQQEKLLFAWINARMKSVQKVMMDSVKGYLLDLTGENMELIDKELEKLIAYAWDRNEITLQDVKRLCPNQLEDQIFEMVKAISEKKQEQALRYYYELLGLKIAPIKILALINRQFQQILHLLGIYRLSSLFHLVSLLVNHPCFVLSKNHSRLYFLRILVVHPIN